MTDESTPSGRPSGTSGKAVNPIEALCDRVFSDDAQRQGAARQRAMLVAGMDAILAEAWDECVAAILSANPGRAIALPRNPYPAPVGPVEQDEDAPGRCPHRETWFDRSLCPEPCATMHTRCSECGESLEPCPYAASEETSRG